MINDTELDNNDNEDNNHINTILNTNENNIFNINNLFETYSKNLRYMVLFNYKYQKKLLDILNKLFIKNNKKLTINNKLNYKQISILSNISYKIIKKLYLECENIYNINLAILELIIEELLFHTITKQLENLNSL